MGYKKLTKESILETLQDALKTGEMDKDIDAKTLVERIANHLSIKE
jgi:chromosomal replication initiation ATPase DnaA